MKNTRKSIDETLSTLRENGMTGTNGEVLHQNICAHYANYAKVCDKQHTDDEKAIALAPVSEAVNLYNDEMRLQRIDALMDMTAKEAMAEFLREQCVSGFKFVKVKDDNRGEYFNVEHCDNVEVDAYDFIKEICKIELDCIMDMVCIFVDNVARRELSSSGATVNKNSLSEGYVSMRKRFHENHPDEGWDAASEDLSLSVLAKQMTAICDKLTFGVGPRMQTTDVKYIKFSVCNGGSQANKAGFIRVRDEKTILRFMFRAIYTRYHKLAYGWQNQAADNQRAPRTSKANKVMAENPKAPEFSPDKVPKAGAVTTGKLEKKVTAPKTGKAKKTEKAAK